MLADNNVRISLLERYFNKNSSSRPELPLRLASGDGCTSDRPRHQQPTNNSTFTLSGSSGSSPQQDALANNDFFYDDEFSVQFDANLNNFDDAPLLQQQSEGCGRSLEISQCSGISGEEDVSFDISEQSWMHNDGGTSNLSESATSDSVTSSLLDDSSCNPLQSAITAWGTFRDLSNLTMISPSDSLIEDVSRTEDEDDDENVDDGNGNDSAECSPRHLQQHLVLWGGFKAPKKNMVTKLESSRPCLSLTNWAKSSSSKDKITVHTNGQLNDAKLTTWQHLQKCPVKDHELPKKMQQQLTTWQNVKSPTKILSSPPDHKTYPHAKVNEGLEDKDVVDGQHGGPLLDRFHQNRFMVELETAEKWFNCDATSCAPVVVDSPDQPYYIGHKSSSVDNFCTPFSEMHEKLFMDLMQQQASHATQPETLVPQVIKIDASTVAGDEVHLQSATSMERDPFFGSQKCDDILSNLASPLDMEMSSSFGSHTLSDVEEKPSMKFDAMSQTSPVVVARKSSRRCRTYDPKSLPDLGFLCENKPKQRNKSTSMFADSLIISTLDAVKDSVSGKLCQSLPNVQATCLGSSHIQQSLLDSLCLSATCSQTSSMMTPSPVDPETSSLINITSFTGDEEEEAVGSVINEDRSTKCAQQCVRPLFSDEVVTCGKYKFCSSEFSAWCDNQLEKKVDSSSAALDNSLLLLLEPDTDLTASCGKLCKVCRPFSTCNANVPCIHDSPHEKLWTEYDFGHGLPLPIGFGDSGPGTLKKNTVSQSWTSGKSILARRGGRLEPLKFQNYDVRNSQIPGVKSRSLVLQSTSVPDEHIKQQIMFHSVPCTNNAVGGLRKNVAKRTGSECCTAQHCVKSVSFSDTKNVVYCITPERDISSPNLLTSDDLGYDSMVTLTPEPPASGVAVAQHNISHPVIGNNNHDNDDDDGELPPSDFTVSTSPPTRMTVSAAAVAGHSVDAVDLMRLQELVADVSRAVQLLVNHFNCASNAAHCEELGNTATNADIGQLVVRHLCPAVHAILLDGLRSHLTTLLGRVKNSAWTVVEDSIKTDTMYDELLAEVKGHDGMNSPWLLFDAFIFALLNHKAIDIWLLHVHSQTALLCRHYTPTAFLRLGLPGSPTRQLYMQLISIVRPLARFPFCIKLDHEFQQLQLRRKQQDDVDRNLSTSSSRLWQRYGDGAAQLMQSAVWSVGSKASEGIDWARKLTSTSLVELSDRYMAASRVLAPSSTQQMVDSAVRVTTQPAANALPSPDQGVAISPAQNSQTGTDAAAASAHQHATDACRQSTDSGFESIVTSSSLTDNISPGQTAAHLPDVCMVSAVHDSRTMNGSNQIEADNGLAQQSTQPTNRISNTDQSVGKITSSDVIQKSVSAVVKSGPVKSWSGFGSRLLGAVDRMLMSDTVDSVSGFLEQLVLKPQKTLLVRDAGEFTSDIQKTNGEESGNSSNLERGGPGLNKSHSLNCIHALCHYVATDSTELSFAKGDCLQFVCQTDNSDWLMCRHGDREGLVHSACVRSCY